VPKSGKVRVGVDEVGQLAKAGGGLLGVCEPARSGLCVQVDEVESTPVNEHRAALVVWLRPLV
jgi:hypothetical protein